MTLEGQIFLAAFIAAALGTFFLFSFAAYVSRRARRNKDRGPYQYHVVERRRRE